MRTGWGEFELYMTIYFRDPNEAPVQKSHLLKLHPPNNSAPSTKKPIINEIYDEIVFVEPTEKFHYMMTNPKETLEYLYSQDDEENKAIEAAKK